MHDVVVVSERANRITDAHAKSVGAKAAEPDNKDLPHPEAAAHRSADEREAREHAVEASVDDGLDVVAVRAVAFHGALFVRHLGEVGISARVGVARRLCFVKGSVGRHGLCVGEGAGVLANDAATA